MQNESKSLVRPLFEGEVDLVGDVHGEIEALKSLLGRLGYDDEGRHPDGRRLVFVGDLVDRGPDSPAVLDFVRDLIEKDLAQCVMGNHELNILVGKVNSRSFWFHQEGDPREPECKGQRLLPSERREEICDFLKTLPLALERDDLCVVHACWDDAFIERLRGICDPLAARKEWRAEIEIELDREGITEKIERNLERQNRNPIKVLTSGYEVRADEPFLAGGRMRHEARSAWWEDCAADAPFCVFGHYLRTDPGTKDAHNEPLFPGAPYTAYNNTMCIDYGVGGRAERRRRNEDEHEVPLAALRWPEKVLVFDTDEKERPIEFVETGDPARAGE